MVSRCYPSRSVGAPPLRPMCSAENSSLPSKSLTRLQSASRFRSPPYQFHLRHPHKKKSAPFYALHKEQDDELKQHPLPLFLAAPAVANNFLLR